MANKFLVHDPGDVVGVAVEDMALVALRRGDQVVEYGEVIGQATADIAAGAHVHVHNITSVRWPKSQAADAKVA